LRSAYGEVVRWPLVPPIATRRPTGEAHADGKGLNDSRRFFYDLHIDHAVSVVAIAEWYQMDGERISAIRSILATAPFISKGGTGAETAADPVAA